MPEVVERLVGGQLLIVPLKWEITSLSHHLQQMKSGASISPSDFLSEGVEVIPKKSISDTTRYKVEEKDKQFVSGDFSIQHKNAIVGKEFLVTALRDLVPTGPNIGRAVKINDESSRLMAQGTYGFQLNTDVDSNYYAYVSNIDYFRSQMKAIMVGSTQVHIRSGEYLAAKFLVPSLESQQKIAKILTTVDNLIEKTQAFIDKYTAIKQGMMADLFTRGIDLTATPETNPNYGQLRPPVEQAPDRYKQTELGWIPKEWDVKPLGDVAEKIQDGTHFSPTIDNGEYMYLTSKNIRFGYLDLSNIENISKPQHDAIYKRCDVQKGDLLLTKDGANTGNAAINDIEEPFSMLSSVAFVRSNQFSTESYLLHYLLSDMGQTRMKDSMSGNAITRLTLEKINNFLVPAPPIEEQQEIAAKLNSLMEVINNEKTYLRKLTASKKGLMHDLLTGKVQVN